MIGLLAGALGAFLIAVTSLILPFCPLDPGDASTKSGFEGGTAWGWREKASWIVAIAICGTLGSVVDSILGGLFQASVVDKRTGKIVEGAGGRKVGLIRHLPFKLPVVHIKLNFISRFSCIPANQ